MVKWLYTKVAICGIPQNTMNIDMADTVTTGPNNDGELLERVGKNINKELKGMEFSTLFKDIPTESPAVEE